MARVFSSAKASIVLNGLRPVRVELSPGMNAPDDASWDRVKADPYTVGLIETGVIVDEVAKAEAVLKEETVPASKAEEPAGDEEQPAGDPILDVPVRELVDALAEVEDLDRLEALLNAETRKTARDMIAARIEELIG